MLSQSSTSRRWQYKVSASHCGKVKLRYGLYDSANQNPDHYVIFLNGRTEWIEKYAFLPDELALPAHCGYLTIDHRGQGASGGTACHVEHYDDFSLDVRKIINEVVGTRPYSIIAHSMGGLISIYGTMKGHIQPRSMVLSGPLLMMRDDPVPKFIARPLAKLMSIIGFAKARVQVDRFDRIPFEKNTITHSRELYQRIAQSAFPPIGPTFQWVNQSFAAMDYVHDPENLRNFRCPTLILNASKEVVVDPRGFSEWVALVRQCSKTKIEIAVIDGALHEVFFEIPEYRSRAIEKAWKWISAELHNLS